MKASFEQVHVILNHRIHDDLGNNGLFNVVVVEYGCGARRMHKRIDLSPEDAGKLAERVEQARSITESCWRYFPAVEGSFRWEAEIEMMANDIPLDYWA